VEELKNANIEKLAAGQFHSLALNFGGTALYAWGENKYGQLGVKDEHGNIPVRVATPTRVDFMDCDVAIGSIAAGESHSMAVTMNKDVYTWGFGSQGQTGHKGSNDVVCPRKLDLAEIDKEGCATAVQVHQAAGGAQHSALLVTRTVSDWSSGQFIPFNVGMAASKAKRDAEQESINTAEAANDNAKRDYSTVAEPASTEHDTPPEPLSWGDVFADLNEGKWQCAACWVHTINEEFQCSACKTPRPPNANAQEETTTTTMAPSATTPNLVSMLFPPVPEAQLRFAPTNTGLLFGANVPWSSSTTLQSLGSAESLQGSIPSIFQSTSMAPVPPFAFGSLAPAPIGNSSSGTSIFGTTGGEAISAPPPRRVTPVPPLESGLVNTDSTPFVFGAQPPPLVPQQTAAMEPSTSALPNVQSPSLVGTANSTNGEAPRGRVTE
jgi:Regulator of chromosome condensation (RCC1) repeat